MSSDTRESATPQGISRPLASVLAVLAGLLRLVPHPWNLTPVGALGLYGGARLRSWHAFALPLAVMAVSDLLLLALRGNRPFNPYVYASFLLYVVLGWTLRNTESGWRIGSATLLGSVLFFLITNFGAWLGSCVDPQSLPAGVAVVRETVHDSPYARIYYARNLQGLIACYGMAIPFFGTDAPPLGFFGNLLLGDFGFVALLFGLHAWLTRTHFVTERVGSLAKSSSSP